MRPEHRPVDAVVSSSVPGAAAASPQGLPAQADTWRVNFARRCRVKVRRRLRARTPSPASELLGQLWVSAARWTIELGALNKFVHTWVYKDVNECARASVGSQLLDHYSGCGSMNFGTYRGRHTVSTCLR
jgi:hypothetical protein